MLLKPLRPHPDMRNLLSATVIGFTAVTLLGRPGEFVRPYLISVKERVPFTSQIAAWVLERIFDLLMALLIFGFALSRVRNLRRARRPGAGLGARKWAAAWSGSWRCLPDPAGVDPALFGAVCACA